MSVVRRLRARARPRDRMQRFAFNTRLMSSLARRSHVIVLGDSHSQVLRHGGLSGWWFDVTVVGGATASGIRNPNSATEALPRYRERLSRAKPWQIVMTMLGEVDCGYIVWRRARTEKISVSASLDETIGRYVEFIMTEIAPRWRVMVMSSPLPSLPDDSSAWGDVAQRRADVLVSQKDRTALTRQFNAAMERECLSRGWRFVDSTEAQLDWSTGVIHGDLVRHGSGDHHLRDDRYLALIGAALPPRG